MGGGSAEQEEIKQCSPDSVPTKKIPKSPILRVDYLPSSALPVPEGNFLSDLDGFLGGFLQDFLPKRLIILPTMKFASNMEIQEMLQQELEKHLVEDDRFRELYTVDAEGTTGDFLKERAAFGILSHRWSKDEMTFQDIIQIPLITERGVMAFTQRHMGEFKNIKTSRAAISKLVEMSYVSPNPKTDWSRPPFVNETPLFHLKELCEHLPHCTGLVKLIKFCLVVHGQHGLRFAWIDTCCVDKTSSVELDEAIRSMFRWYRNSSICIIHLTSVTNIPGARGWCKSLGQDPWFRRGWTLQELLAPSTIKFYNSAWLECTTGSNDKSNQQSSVSFNIIGVSVTGADYLFNSSKIHSMADILSGITSIPKPDLLDFRPGLHNLRQRLSWASKRQTTRVEDMAYSLLGIFDVSMPIAYGEGDIAFYRLQAAIMERSNDRSLFQWSGDSSRHSSMLARNAKCFSSEYAHIDALSSPSNQLDRSMTILPEPNFALTNHGLQISVSLYDSDFTSGWIFSLQPDFKPDSFSQWNKPDQHEFRLAVFGYSAGRPIVMLLIQHQNLEYTYYERHPWQPRAVDGLSVEPGKPEIVFIR